MGTRFGILGTIEVRRDGVPVDAGHAVQRRVLAALLVDADRTVSADALVDRVWGDTGATNGRTKLYGYVSRLRHLLAGGGTAIIRDGGGGYRLAVERALVDIHCFRDLSGLARRAGTDEQAEALWREALGLWRGSAFTGVDTPWFNAQRDLLDGERLAAQLELVDVRLRLAQHDRLVSELLALVAAHPLDERVVGQLMLALYRCGRQAEALEGYERARRRLAEELGVDPGAELRRLHERILGADPELDGAQAEAAVVPAARRSRPVPRQLPPSPRAFVGRDHELAALDNLLKESLGADRVLVISAIGGVGGIGKTWLALRWAHEHLARFPDGQLYVNLRGFDPIAGPLPVPTVVRGFLDALGADLQEIPANPEAQSGLYRSLVADRQMLIVLDNAHDADQIRPLLPGSATCMVLVTSRRHLGALTATHGSHYLALDTLPDDEARQIFARALGPDRLAAEPDAVDALLRCCAGLPLAMGIVAARAAARPDFPLRVLAEELDDATSRLDALSGGDLTTDLRAVFDTSHRALEDPTAQVFALLGLAPGPDISLPAAASLAALPFPRARLLLRDLEEAHLLRQHAPGRYRMHDLVRLYSTEHGRSQPTDIRTAALCRVVDFYLHTAHAGDRLLFPHRTPIELDAPTAGCTPLPLEKAEAPAWFDREHLTLLAAQALALEQGRDRQAWQLAWTLDLFQRQRGRLQDGLTTWRTGLTAAERLGAPAAQATAHWLLSRTRSDMGENTVALKHLQQAFALFEEASDTAGQAHVHRTMARVQAQQSNHQQALRHAQHALRLYQTLDNPVWEANALNAVGWNHALLGHHKLARSHCTRALTLFREVDYRIGQAAALDSLGYIARRTGQYAEALDHYRHALRLCREANDSAQVADALFSLGTVHKALGQHTDARHSWQQALDLYRSQNRAKKAQDTEEQLRGSSLVSDSGPGDH
ncbi:AfsR/SARP family transcriptional regulator [Streptomyces bluensis]|uniref:AfsR/SARP family transcriptional regulator n=1 Tax=Streptomyces bluensis TaxID=33897 RepID=UPI001677DCA3|nr:BTAD domain-containing putative transcriptional regulator [Streptomyces bluensis]GGZ97454.1 hypothetical protein GCM10010344_76900 [Streptomyces bluensis]